MSPRLLWMALLVVAAVLGANYVGRTTGPGPVTSGSPTSSTASPAPSVANMASSISVIDGDTVSHQGRRSRLVGFDAPETGGRAACDDERQRAARATSRLQQLMASGNVNLQRVPCACKPGTEGTAACNFGRFCGRLTVDGRDVGPILIGEGLAHSFVCGATSCPKRQPWC